MVVIRRPPRFCEFVLAAAAPKSKFAKPKPAPHITRPAEKDKKNNWEKLHSSTK
jgi:hypothetical protein